jgi:Helix-turn-helix.
MPASITLLDKYKKTCSLASDNACAVSLGVTRSAVSLWRNGKGHPEADSVERMCEATGEPLARWLPLIEAERARSPGARRAWLRLAQVAAVMTVVLGSLAVPATTVRGADFVPHNSGTLYIM